MNLSTTHEKNITALPCEMQNLFIFTVNIDSFEKAGCSVVWLLALQPF